MKQSINQIEDIGSGGTMRRFAMPLVMIATVSSGANNHMIPEAYRSYNDNEIYNQAQISATHEYFQGFSNSSGGYTAFYDAGQDQEAVISEFANQMLKDMHDVPEEFAQLLEENFWDVLA